MPETGTTRCPQCKVAFHVTSAQLCAAKGTVRCGICLTQFDGNENACADPQLSTDHTDTDTDTESIQQSEPIAATEHIETPLNIALEESGVQNIDVGQLPSHQQLDALSESWRSEQQPSAEKLKPRTGAWRGKQWTIFLLLLTSIVVLFMQLLYFTSSELSLDERYRPTLEVACGLLGCPIAEQRNINLIQSNALVVQKHPNRKDALQLDMVLTNRATFAQPFPGLLLQFEGLQGQITAQRKFTPEEYLLGALASISLMEPEQPYRIKLEIFSPDSTAISYSLTVTN